jgi:predicted lysophospholipase L1 biosynthesis ABC-type transport system permease subunit
MPDIYIPILQSPRQGGLVFLRSRMPAASVAALVAAEMRALDADVPLSEIKGMEERVADATWRTRAVTWLLSLFGAMALLLASIGVFGVMSQSVAERRREIGVRMALGAAPRDIFSMIVGRAARVSVAGVIVGFAASLGLMRVLGSLLFEIDPHDPATFWLVAAIVLTVALVASYLPARRAARVDPLTTMRTE